MVVLEGWRLFLMSEVPLYATPPVGFVWAGPAALPPSESNARGLAYPERWLITQVESPITGVVGPRAIIPISYLPIPQPLKA
jgi:hypothetical protein